MTDNQMLTLNEVADRLGISYQGARMLVLFEDKIPHIKVGARGVRVKEADVDRYVAELEEQSKAGREPKEQRKPYKGREILSKKKQEI